MPHPIWVMYQNLRGHLSGSGISGMPGVGLLKRRVIDRWGEHRVLVFGRTLFLDPVDSLNLRRDGYWEPEETEVVRSHVKEGDLVLDIGAHIGYYTVLMADLVGPKGQVYAFEADPGNASILRRNIRENGFENVTVIEKAVSDSNTPITLFHCETNHGMHRIYSSRFTGDEKVEVDSVRLDEFFADREIEIDFIKMDVEGSEPGVLEGMKGLWETKVLKKVKMVTEFLPVGLNEFGVNPETYLRTLTRLGFELRDIRQSLRRVSVLQLVGQYGSEYAHTNLLVSRDLPLNESSATGRGSGLQDIG